MYSYPEIIEIECPIEIFGHISIKYIWLLQIKHTSLGVLMEVYEQEE